MARVVVPRASPTYCGYTGILQATALVAPLTGDGGVILPPVNLLYTIFTFNSQEHP